MKSLSVFLVLVVAFAACGYAQKPVNYFDRVIQEMNLLGQTIPAFRPFVPRVNAGIRKNEAAAKSGDKNAMLESLAEGLQNAKLVSSSLKSNPKIYELNKRTPAMIKNWMAQIEQGAKTPQDVNKFAGYYNKQIKEGGGEA